MAAEAQEQRQRKLRETVSECLWKSLQQVCGGSLTSEQDQNSNTNDLVRDSCRTSISFPNKDETASSLACRAGGGGKPHDIEVRLALSLFHRWRRQQQQQQNQNQHNTNAIVVVTITSDMGLQRQVHSPAELAALLILPLETNLRHETIAHDVQCHASGVIGIVTMERSYMLRHNYGKVPCPQCPKWCQGSKGLWWHQQQCHSVEYSEATLIASSTSNETLAMIPYDNNNPHPSKNRLVFNKNSPKGEDPTKSLCHDKNNNKDPLELIKHGNLNELQRAVEVRQRERERDVTQEDKEKKRNVSLID
jgi:hypothetical protein